MAIDTISPRDLAARRTKTPHLELIDVRTPAEFREIHAEFARNLPLSELDPAAVMKDRSVGQPLYFICRSGSRGQQACEKFRAAGYENVVNVEGGTLAWAEAGLPVARGKKTMALERQVRIVAGALVLLGVLAGLANEWFLLLPAFVGSGLIFAGVTDSCALGMFLARMPWNQVKPPSSSNANGPSCAVPRQPLSIN